MLGYANPDKMLVEMDAVMLAEWIALEQFDPSGEARADLRNADLMCLMANINGAKTKPKDFMRFLK